MTQQEQVIEELWHNLYRMHGYLEAQIGVVGGGRPGLLKNAGLLLAASHGRVIGILKDIRRLEPLPACCKLGRQP